MMNGFVIDVGHQGQGTTFQLDPKSQILLEERFPTAQPVVSVYLSYRREQDLSLLQDSTWQHVAELLTNLSGVDIDQQGGFEVVVPSTGRLVYSSRRRKFDQSKIGPAP